MKYKNFTKLALLFLNINNVYSKTYHDDKHINNIDYNFHLDTNTKMQTYPSMQNDFVANSTAPNNNVSFIATSITTAYILSNNTNRPLYNRGNILVSDNRADEKTSQQIIPKKPGQSNPIPKQETDNPIPKPKQNNQLLNKENTKKNPEDNHKPGQSNPIPKQETDKPKPEQKQNNPIPKPKQNNPLSNKENTKKNPEDNHKPQSMKDIKHQLQDIIIKSVIRDSQNKQNNTKKEILKPKHIVTRLGQNTSNNTFSHPNSDSTSRLQRRDNTPIELKKPKASVEERATVNLLRKQLLERIAKFPIPEKNDLQQQINEGNLSDLIHITDLITALKESLALNTSKSRNDLPQLQSRIKPAGLTQEQKENIFFNNTLKLFCEFLIEKNPVVYNQFIKSVKIATLESSDYYNAEYIDIEIMNNQKNNIYDALDGVLGEYSEEILDSTINKSKYVIPYKNKEIILIIQKKNPEGKINLLSFEDLSAQNSIPTKEILINNHGGSCGLEGNQCGIASFMHSILEKIIYVKYITTKKLLNIEQNTLQNFIDKCNIFLQNSISKAQLNHKNPCLLEPVKIQGKNWYEHVYLYMRDLYLSLHTIANEGGRQLDIADILFSLQNDIAPENKFHLMQTGREYIYPTYDEKVVLPYFQQINIYRLDDKGGLLDICQTGANGHFVNKIKLISENGDFSFYNFLITSIKSYNNYLSDNKDMLERYFRPHQRQYSDYYNNLDIGFFQPIVAKTNK